MAHRHVWLAAIGAAALSGCATFGTPDPKSGARVEFRASGESEGSWITGVMYRRSDALRLDFVDPNEGAFSVIVEGDALLLIGSENGKQFVVKMPVAAGDMLPVQDLVNPVSADARAIGACSGARETGRLYEQVRESVTTRLCVTSDNLLLTAEESGKRTWETSAIRRERIEDSIFTPPVGVEVVDLTRMGADKPPPPGRR